MTRTRSRCTDNMNADPVIITDPAEWDRIIGRLDPSPLYVTTGEQSFRLWNGRLMVFRATEPTTGTVP